MVNRSETVTVHSEMTVRDLLSTVSDPEVPAISIIELGIVRRIEMKGERVSITLTPTYSGCPAMNMIENEIRTVLSANGIPEVEITTVFSPAWTTDWMDETAKQKLKQYGIAPPMHLAQSALLQIELPSVRCPHCNSADTQMKSAFGSTSCKAYYFCRSCSQPFEYFKPF